MLDAVVGFEICSAEVKILEVDTIEFVLPSSLVFCNAVELNVVVALAKDD